MSLISTWSHGLLCQHAKRRLLTVFNFPKRLRRHLLLLPHVLHKKGEWLKGFSDLSQQAQDAPDYTSRVTCAFTPTSTQRVGSEPHELPRKVGDAQEVAMRGHGKEERGWDRKWLAV